MHRPWTRRAAFGAAALLPAAAISGPAAAQSGTDSTLDRITRTKVLRIAALPGETPYFQKDIASGEWRGACISMARDIAAVWDAKLEYVESTYGNSVLDLQSNKVDLAFALAPTPQRALSIGFTVPFLVHPYGAVTKRGLDAQNWDDLNKAELRICYDQGSLHETCAKHYTPKAQLIGLKTRDEATLALQSGRADAQIMAVMLSLSALAKNPSLGTYHLLGGPTVALPSSFGVRREPDTRFLEVVNAWIAYNRGTGQIREWLLDGLALNGVKREDIPANLTF
jgi:polar amino acid transport system substrate-binding protein